jgi:hypothetical protein
VGVNQNGVNHTWYSHQEKKDKYMHINQPKDINPTMRVCRLRSAVNWQGALKQKCVK